MGDHQGRGELRLITQLSRFNTFTDDEGKLVDTSYQWMLNVSNLSMIVGTGSPEGVVTARQTRLYLQTDGAARNILWVKKLDDIGGDRSTGWELI